MASVLQRTAHSKLTVTVLASALASGCSSPLEQAGPETVKLTGFAMGTAYSVTVPGADARDEPPIALAVREELERVDALMSTYREDSELSLFNRHDSSDPFPLSEDTYAVLASAQAVSKQTGGAFDVTVGPLVDAWGFGPAGESEPPSEAELDRLLGDAGWSKLTLNDADRTATKAVPKLRCDLSAIAKGFAVDRVASALEGLGFADYLVEVGGEVRAGGLNEERKPWRLGVERPNESGRTVQRILPVSGTGLATSGDYRQFREVGGERFSHVIDPRTGKPATSRVASATVLDPSAMRADAFATALVVLGEAEGLRVAERANLAALLIIRDREGGLREVPTSLFRARMNH